MGDDEAKTYSTTDLGDGCIALEGDAGAILARGTPLEALAVLVQLAAGTLAATAQRLVDEGRPVDALALTVLDVSDPAGRGMAARLAPGDTVAEVEATAAEDTVPLIVGPVGRGRAAAAIRATSALGEAHAAVERSMPGHLPVLVVGRGRMTVSFERLPARSVAPAARGNA